MYDYEPDSRIPVPQDHAPNYHAWYALHAQSKFEKLATTVLRDKGFEVFLPVYRATRQWSDRVKKLDLPLFPGYLFCRFDTAELLPIVTTPGVLRIVGIGKKPVAVSDHEIEAVQAVVDSGLMAMPWPDLSTGSPVLIEHGPLAGVEGIVLEVNKKYRLIVSVTLLQRAVAVEIEREWIRPLAQIRTVSCTVPLSNSFRNLPVNRLEPRVDIGKAYDSDSIN
jgi:transcription antitermination factor NusG